MSVASSSELFQNNNVSVPASVLECENQAQLHFQSHYKERQSKESQYKDKYEDEGEESEF